MTTTISAHRISDTTPSTGAAGKLVVVRTRSGDDRLTQRIEWTGADVAINDADAAKSQAPQSGVGRSVGAAVDRNFAPDRSAYTFCHGVLKQDLARL